MIGEPILQAEGLYKRFGKVEAVKDISFDVQPGEAVALLGANGAGKSTTIEMLLGLRQADKGRVELFGAPPNSIAARKQIGVILQNTSFPDQMRAGEILDYAKAYYDEGLSKEHLINQFGLEKLIDRKCSGFSGGEKRRLALALAFCGNPSLVFLDEPTAGLDAKAQEEFAQYARRFVKAGGSLVLTSHDWSEIETVSDRIILIKAGEVLLEGSVSQMRNAVGLMQVSFAVPEKTDVPALKWLEQMFEFQFESQRWQSVVSKPDDLVRQLVANVPEFFDLTIERFPLKDVVRHIESEASEKGHTGQSSDKTNKGTKK